MKLDRTSALMLAGGAIAAFALYESLKGTVSSAVSTVTQPIANAVGNLYLWFTSGPSIQASGQIVFQNGTTVPVSSIAGGIQFDDVNNVGVFNYNGVQYAIPQGACDANGNCPAVPYSSVLGASG